LQTNNYHWAFRLWR